MVAGRGGHVRPDRSCRNGTCQPTGGAPDLLLLSVAPAAGTGMGTECACANVTGSAAETVTTTRASTAYCHKADGTTVACSSNLPRVESVSSALRLRSEPACTALVTANTEDLTTGWTLNGTTTATANQYTAPDGTATMDKLAKSSADGLRFKSIGAFVGTASVSAWGRADTGTEEFTLLANCNGGSTSACTCKMDDGSACTAGIAGTICTAYPTGGVGTTSKRMALTVTCGGGSSLVVGWGPGIFNSDASATVGLWGFHAETNSFATSYTQGANRVADNISVPKPAAWADGAGCMGASFNVAGVNSGARILAAASGGSIFLQSATEVRCTDGTNTVTATVADVRDRTVRAVCRWSGATLTLVADGVTASGSYDGTITGATVYLGGSNGSNALGGRVSAVALGSGTTACD